MALDDYALKGRTVSSQSGSVLRSDHTFDLGQIRNWNDVLSKSYNNLEIEDIEAYFDANSDNDDFSDLSDHNSDSDICSEENHNKESEFDLKIKQQTYWFCKVLVLWQCIHYISDAAVTLLLNILSAFFKLLSTNSEVCSKIESSFPGNMYQLSKLLQSNMLDFKQYVVCTKCYSLYDFDDCFHVVEGLRFSNTCSYVEFPNHRLPHLRKRCNEPLLKEINNSSSKILVPYKIYCYKSIKSSLSFFVKRNNFEDLCEQWRTRETKEGIMYDIYDASRNTENRTTPGDQETTIYFSWKKSAKRALRRQQRKEAAIEREQFLQRLEKDPNDKAFFQLIKRNQSSIKSNGPEILIDGVKTAKTPSSQRETFADYFKNLATPQENPNFKDELLTNSSNRCNLIKEVSKNSTKRKILVTQQEILNAIQKLKNGKSPDEYGITAEHIKYAGNEITHIYQNIFNQIFEEGKVATSFKTGIITPVPKKGKDLTQATNYRGIMARRHKSHV
ncbi:unnamed protein product [Mytilus edulis]|uniref:Uncharacterized protein n=1 Tax=Mytilus edulis TaxID=6550 RepID=A0A8S3UHV0_MYTED|nr:unnamed protein product [Mytilus edulis]